MAVALDTVNEDSTAAGVPETTRTFSHTCSGSDRLMIVDVCNDEDGSGVGVASITYNAVALTERISDSVSSLQRASIWYLVAPATGAHNVVVTLASAQEFTVASRSYTGVHQTTPLGTAASATGHSTTASVDVSSATTELVHDAVSVNGPASYTIGGGQTQRWARTASNGAPAVIVDSRGSTETGAATTTMSWTLALSDDWVIAAVPIKPATTAGSGTVTIAGGGDLTVGAGVAGPDHDFQVAIRF